MKNKISLCIYAVIGTVFAGLSVFTTVFESLHFELVFSYLGRGIGLVISASVLIGIAKAVLKEITER